MRSDGENNRGFSTLELLMVMALLGIAGCFCLFADFGSLRRAGFNADRDTVLAALRRARGLAMSNVCSGDNCAAGKSHGVHFDPIDKEFVIFQGGAFNAGDSGNEKIEFESGVRVFVSSVTDVVFEPISGNADPAVLILKDDFGRAAAISVNEAGRIDRQ